MIMIKIITVLGKNNYQIIKYYTEYKTLGFIDEENTTVVWKNI